MSRFLVLYRGGDSSKLSPKENETLMKNGVSTWRSWRSRAR